METPNGIPTEGRHLTETSTTISFDHKSAMKLSPVIKFSQHRPLEAVYYANQMDQDGFPNPQFKLMQQVNNQHKKKIETCVTEPF
jgi:hypothetical protein